MYSPPIFLRRGSRKIGGYPLVYIIYLLDSMPCISRDQEYTTKIHTFFEFQSIKVKIWGFTPTFPYFVLFGVTRSWNAQANNPIIITTTIFC